MNQPRIQKQIDEQLNVIEADFRDASQAAQELADNLQYYSRSDKLIGRIDEAHQSFDRMVRVLQLALDEQSQKRASRSVQDLKNELGDSTSVSAIFAEAIRILERTKWVRHRWKYDFAPLRECLATAEQLWSELTSDEPEWSTLERVEPFITLVQLLDDELDLEAWTEGLRRVESDFGSQMAWALAKDELWIVDRELPPESPTIEPISDNTEPHEYTVDDSSHDSSIAQAYQDPALIISQPSSEEVAGSSVDDGAITTGLNQLHSLPDNWTENADSTKALLPASDRLEQGIHDEEIKTLYESTIKLRHDHLATICAQDKVLSWVEEFLSQEASVSEFASVSSLFSVLNRESNALANHITSLQKDAKEEPGYWKNRKVSDNDRLSINNLERESRELSVRRLDNIDLGTLLGNAREVFRLVRSNSKMWNKDGKRKLVASASRVFATICLFRVQEYRANLELMNREVQSMHTGAISRDALHEIKVACRFSEIVYEACDSWRQMAHTKGIEFHHKGDDLAVRVHVVREEILDAVKNIVINAVKYNWPVRSGSAWVSFRGKVGRKTLKLEVESWGEKISEQEIMDDSLFKDGVRGKHLSDERKSEGGTGLGLGKAREAFRKFDGDIEIASKPTNSEAYITTVTLTLPIYR